MYFYYKKMSRKIKIKIKGHLDASWKEWFEGLEISEGNNTVLYGEAIDEAHIHGILGKIRDLNLKLLSVDIIEDTENNQSL